jgi:hypothetical protein
MNVDLIEEFKNMEVNGEVPFENGDSIHEVYNACTVLYHPEHAWCLFLFHIEIEVLNMLNFVNWVFEMFMPLFLCRHEISMKRMFLMKCRMKPLMGRSI